MIGINDYESPTGMWSLEPRGSFLTLDTVGLSDEHLNNIADLITGWPFAKRSMGHLVLGYCLLAGVLPTAALAEPHCDISQFTPANTAFQKGVASGEKGERAYFHNGGDGWPCW